MKTKRKDQIMLREMTNLDFLFHFCKCVTKTNFKAKIFSLDFATHNSVQIQKRLNMFSGYLDGLRLAKLFNNIKENARKENYEYLD